MRGSSCWLRSVRLISISLAFPHLTDIEVNIPIIVVSTKYDMLVNEKYMEALERNSEPSEYEIETATENYFNDHIKNFRVPPGMEVPIVKVSISKDYQRLCFFRLQVDPICHQLHF